MDPIDALLNSSWRRFAERFWTLVWIFALPAVLIIAGELLTARSIGSPANFFASGAASAANSLGGASVAGALLSLVGTILSVFATVAMINTLARGTDLAASVRVGARLFWPALWVGVLNVVAILGGAILVVVPGIIIGVSLLFANYALVVEDKRGLAALSRSLSYVKGRWWEVFARIALAGIVIIALVLFVYSPLYLFFGPAIGSVVYLVIIVVFTAWSFSYVYEMYENLRRLAAAHSLSGAAHDAPKMDGLLKACLIVGTAAVGIFIVLSVLSGFAGSG